MKEEFKKFVQSHPELIKFVNKNEMTWQKFYDMYSLYGDKKEAWKDYFNDEVTSSKTTTITDIVEALKKVDMDQVQKNITTINKALTLIGSLLTKDEETIVNEPMPLYKKFED